MTGLCCFCLDFSEFDYVSKKHRTFLKHSQIQKNEGKNVPTFSMLKCLDGQASNIKKGEQL